MHGSSLSRPLQRGRWNSTQHRPARQIAHPIYRKVLCCCPLFGLFASLSPDDSLLGAAVLTRHPGELPCSRYRVAGRWLPRPRNAIDLVRLTVLVCWATIGWPLRTAHPTAGVASRLLGI